MDRKGRHVEEWSDVLVEVEKAIKFRQIDHKNSKGQAPKFRMPAKQSIDGTLLSLRKERKNATTFKRIRNGKATVTESAREKGVEMQSSLTKYLKPGWRNASEDERRQFIEWLKKEADLDKYL